MQIYPAKSDYPCFICKANTSWYCVGCKLWVCASRRATKNSLKELELYSHTIKSKPSNFVKSCFHKMHQEAWQRSDQNQQNSFLSNLQLTLLLSAYTILMELVVIMYCIKSYHYPHPIPPLAACCSKSVAAYRAIIVTNIIFMTIVLVTFGVVGASQAFVSCVNRPFITQYRN